jgi:hypothetical protein
MANIHRLLKCNNPTSEAYNFGGLIFYLLSCVARETGKISDAPPARRLKYSYIAANTDTHFTEYKLH